MKYKPVMEFCKCIFFLLLCFSLPAQSFVEGEKLLKSNRPVDAIPYFQSALTEEPINPLTWTYLGTCYFQLGQTQEALDTFLLGTQKSGTNKRALYFNAGNMSFVLGDYKKAEQYYSIAVTADSTFSNAYLNRGNARLKQQQLQSASDDYTQFLLLSPAAPQADIVRRLLSALEDEITAQQVEAQRLAQEAEKIKAEEDRIAAELAKQAEEQKVLEEAARIEAKRIAAEKAALEAEQAALEAERRRKMLEDIASALQAVEATNLSSGTEGVEEYEYEESELD